jgi:ABC-type taurine transport system ATPase subunit
MIRSTLIGGPGTRPHRVVLYHREHSLHPWVVHYQLEEDGSKFQGSYCETLARAAQEFLRRLDLTGAREETLATLLETEAQRVEETIRRVETGGR